MAIAGHGDKRPLTTVRCAALTGEVLPIQLVYEGKPGGATHLIIFLVIGSSVTVQIIGPLKFMIEYITDVFVSFVEQKRDDLELNSDLTAVAIFDHFKVQLTEKVSCCLKENNIHSVLISIAYTGGLQPMDIFVNKAIKSFLHNKFSEWYSEQVTGLYCNDEDDPMDLSLA